MICTKGEMFDLLADTVAKLEYDLDARVITWASKPLEQMFGYALRGELDGQPVEKLIPVTKQEIHQGHVGGYALHPEARTMGVRLLVEGQRRDGSTFPAAVQLCPGMAGPIAARRRVVVAIVLDMTGVARPIPAVVESPASAIPLVSPRLLPALLLGMMSTALLVWVVLFLCGFVGGNAMAAEDQLHAAMSHMRQRDYTKAALHFAEAAKSGADVPLALGGQAECLFYLGRYEEALAVCADLEQRVANAGRAAHIRGLVFLKRGEKGRALEQFRLAAKRGEVAALTMLRGER